MIPKFASLSLCRQDTGEGYALSNISGALMKNTFKFEEKAEWIEKGQIISFSSKEGSGEEIYVRFPPIMFCMADSDQSRQFVCHESWFFAVVSRQIDIKCGK